MDELATHNRAVQGGGVAAYGEIVRRVRTMACGCAYAVLGDFDLAGDAAQKAFPVHAVPHTPERRPPCHRPFAAARVFRDARRGLGVTHRRRARSEPCVVSAGNRVTAETFQASALFNRQRGRGERQPACGTWATKN